MRDIYTGGEGERKVWSRGRCLEKNNERRDGEDHKYNNCDNHRAVIRVLHLRDIHRIFILISSVWMIQAVFRDDKGEFVTLHEVHFASHRRLECEASTYLEGKKGKNMF